MFGRKHGKAHSAAVKAARPLEVVDEERKQLLMLIGSHEYERRVREAQILALAQRLQQADHERELATEKAQQDAREAARLAGTLCICGEPQHPSSVLYEGSKQWTCKGRPA